LLDNYGSGKLDATPDVNPQLADELGTVVEVGYGHHLSEIQIDLTRPRLSESEVAEILNKAGLEIPDNVALHYLAKEDYDFIKPGNSLAFYTYRVKDQLQWSDFLHEGKVVVRVDSSVLHSEEALVRVIAHELHEITNLQDMFAGVPSISGNYIHNIVSSTGALHNSALRHELLVWTRYRTFRRS
jgi:hypothetical protein